MAVQTQTRVDRPQQGGAAGRPVASERSDSPRVLLRLPDFRARQPRYAAPSSVTREIENYEGAPAPVSSPPPVKTRRPVPWKKLLLTSQGHSRITWVWATLRTSSRLLTLLWREPKLWMAIMGALGLQAAGVVAFLNMGSAPTATDVPAAVAPVPALLVEPTPLLPLQTPAAGVPTPAPPRPMQTPLSPPMQPKPTTGALPAPMTIPAPTVREPVLPSTSPRLGNPNDKLPWEEWSSPDKPGAGPASNSSADAGAANQPAMLPGGTASGPAEPRMASRPQRAKLKGTIQKLNNVPDSKLSQPRLY